MRRRPVSETVSCLSRSLASRRYLSSNVFEYDSTASLQPASGETRNLLSYSTRVYLVSSISIAALTPASRRGSPNAPHHPGRVERRVYHPNPIRGLRTCACLVAIYSNTSGRWQARKLSRGDADESVTPRRSAKNHTGSFSLMRPP